MGSINKAEKINYQQNWETADLDAADRIALAPLPTPTKTSKISKFFTRPHHKLKKLVAGFALGLTVATTSLPNRTRTQRTETLDPSKIDNAELQIALEQFQAELKSRYSERERDMLAQLVYGEAGRELTDAFEVIHTVLNRASSDYFSHDLATVIAQKGQFIGYKPTNPVTPEIRRIVDLVVDDWEQNGRCKIQDCEHYYFVTGIPGVCNKFEISQNHQPTWVPQSKKRYEKLHHYCPTAHAQATRYLADCEARQGHHLTEVNIFQTAPTK